tara:strand:+ start:5073 stop:5468 length:396 start_codon:yes stop_codon:yes gene_type:complete
MNNTKANQEFLVGVISGKDGNSFVLDGVEMSLDNLVDHINFLSKQEPKALLDRIQAQYPDFEVVELEWDGDGLYRMPSGAYHINAQSMKGFYRYVYFDPDGDFFQSGDPTTLWDTGATIHPVAVLFSRVES